MGFVHKARSLWARLGWEGTGKTLKWSLDVFVQVIRITDPGRTQTSQVNIKPGGRNGKQAQEAEQLGNTSHLCVFRSHCTEVPKEGGLSPLTLHPHVVACLRTNGITFESPVIINPKRE